MKKLLLIICGMLFVSVAAVQAQQQSDTSRIRLNRQSQELNRQQDPTQQKSTQDQSQYRRDQTQGQYQTDTTGQPTMNRQGAQDTQSIQSSQGSQNFRKDTTGASPAQLRSDTTRRQKRDR